MNKFNVSALSPGDIIFKAKYDFDPNKLGVYVRDWLGMPVYATKMLPQSLIGLNWNNVVLDSYFDDDCFDIIAHAIQDQKEYFTPCLTSLLRCRKISYYVVGYYSTTNYRGIPASFRLLLWKSPGKGPFWLLTM